MKRILITGSIAYDFLLTYDGSFTDAIDPHALEEFSAAYVTPRFARHHGGTAANIAWKLRLLGGRPLLVGTVGHDGGSYLALLQERSIDTSRVEVLKDHATAMAIVATDDLEHQITFYHPGADSAGSWPDLSDDCEDIAYAIVSPRDARLMQEALRWCHMMKVPTIFDPGQQMLAFGEDALRRAIAGSKGVIVNAFEWDLLSDRTKFSEEELLQHTEFLVVTHGEKGAVIHTREGQEKIAACVPDAVLNPTGAGDAFRSGLLAGLALGWPLRDAGRLGAAMGSFVVEIEGTLLENLDIDEARERARRTYSEPLPRLPS